MILSLPVHPCDQEENGGCSQKCVKNVQEEEEAEDGEDGDGYRCACDNDRFELAADGKTCKPSKNPIHPCR